MNQRLGQSAYY